MVGKVGVMLGWVREDWQALSYAPPLITGWHIADTHAAETREAMRPGRKFANNLKFEQRVCDCFLAPSLQPSRWKDGGLNC